MKRRKLKEWEVHVTTEPGRAACGTELHPYDWTFRNPEHARESVAQGSRLLPCPYCAEALGIDIS